MDGYIDIYKKGTSSINGSYQYKWHCQIHTVNLKWNQTDKHFHQLLSKANTNAEKENVAG